MFNEDCHCNLLYLAPASLMLFFSSIELIEKDISFFFFLNITETINVVDGWWVEDPQKTLRIEITSTEDFTLQEIKPHYICQPLCRPF